MKYDQNKIAEYAKFKPYARVVYKGAFKELISYPFPAEESEEESILVRDRGDPTTMEYVALADVFLTDDIDRLAMWALTGHHHLCRIAENQEGLYGRIRAALAQTKG